MTIDLSDTITTKSDQLNAIDLIGGPITVTITGVKKVEGEKKQPTILEISGGFKPYKPCLNMRRILVKAWGMDGAAYVGRSMTLFRDPEIVYGNEAIGGIRIAALSHIPEKFDLRLIESKRLPKVYHIESLGGSSAKAKPTQPASQSEPDPALLAEFADLCAELQAAKDQSVLDACLAGCTRIKSRLDKKSITTLADLAKAAQARIATVPATLSTGGGLSLFERYAERIEATDAKAALLNAILDDIAADVSEGHLTGDESERLTQLCDAKMATV